jgi:pimeloyl-ACP methyl ester carboxylesterase
VLLGMYAGGAASIVFAATHPERVEGLVLMSSYARLRRADDYPIGVDDEAVDQLARLMLESWGTGASIEFTNPSVAGDPAARRWFAEMERLAASPASAAAMARKWFDPDVRDVLPLLHVPTVVIARDHLGSRVMSQAAPGEILVSRTIRDLVAGSSLRFVPRGTHELKGVPELWELFSVAEPAA